MEYAAGATASDDACATPPRLSGTVTWDRRLRPALLLALVALATPAALGAQSSLRDAVSRVGDSVLRDQLSQVYAGWSWRLLWWGPAGPLPRADTLLAWIDRAADDGLDPADYDAPGLRAAWRAEGDSSLADADVRLSVAFLRLGHDLAVGRVSPALVDSLWDGVPAPPNLVAALSGAIERDAVAGVLRTLRPPDARYAALRGALLRYRGIAERGGWGVIDSGPDLRIGDRGPRVVALRERLAATGDLPLPAESAEVFDRQVDRALRGVQARMGLTADGVMGPATRAALNVTVERRIRAIAMTLERWRWTPRVLPTRYLIVNIPAYALELHDSSSRLALRVIVGRRDWPTPITNAWMDGLTFGPEWNVPRAIAIQELAPLERARPGYLAREGFRVVQAGTGVAIDPDSIDWADIDSAHFPFRLVQEPGPGNPLGAIRFDVRDPFNVTIHDTPQHDLFNDRVRIFSHGCVRVDSAAALAARLLPDWSREDIDRALRDAPGRTVALERRLRVLLTYQTAWVETDGGVAFRDDVYGWDDELGRALFRIAEISAAGREQRNP